MHSDSPEPGHIPTLNLGHNAAKRRRREDWRRLRAINVALMRQHEPGKPAPKRKRVITLLLLNKGIEYRRYLHTGGNNV